MLTYYVTIMLVAFLGGAAQKYKLKESESQLRTTTKVTDSNICLIAAAFVLIVVSGLRYGVGADYFSYAHAFFGRKYALLRCIFEFRDPGFALINTISWTIYDDYVVMFFFSAMVTVGLIVLPIAKYSDDFVFSLLLFIFIGAWHGSFNAVRQYLAMAVLFYGHRYIYKKDLTKYAITVAVAFCFHKTALVMFPIYFVFNYTTNKQFIISMIIVTIIMYFMKGWFIDVMSEIKGKHQDNLAYTMRAVNNLRILVALAPLAIPFITSMRFFDDNENFFYFKLLALNASFMLATGSSAYLARVAIYSDIYGILALPRLVKAFPRNQWKYIKLGILVLYFAFWYIEVTNRDTLMPFIWIFSR